MPVQYCPEYRAWLGYTKRGSWEQPAPQWVVNIISQAQSIAVASGSPVLSRVIVPLQLQLYALQRQIEFLSSK